MLESFIHAGIFVVESNLVSTSTTRQFGLTKIKLHVMSPFKKKIIIRQLLITH